MTKAGLLTLPLLATLICPAAGRGEELLLYTPKTADSAQAPASPDQGILVREITIKRGDTLMKLSRRHLGRASWYPQVLVFNAIKNPDLIYAGTTLKVPVPPGKPAAGAKSRARGKKARTDAARLATPATPSTSSVAPVLAAPPAAQPVTSPDAPATSAPSAPSHARTPVTAPASPAAPASEARPAGSPASAQQLAFIEAIKAYGSGDCRNAVPLFEQFLSTFPHSALASDAELYRADCLLQLSGQ